MHSTSLFALAAFATSVLAMPAANSYVPGQCGIHFIQSQRANNDDLVEYQVKDGAGNLIGDQTPSNGLSDATPASIASQLPDLITCTQPANSHDINCSYQGQNFGSTDPSCGVGDFDDGTRQIDCGFSC